MANTQTFKQADTAEAPTLSHFAPSERVVALIPCYNTRKYIRQAVLSLLNQTRKIDLIVILNDCSTDGFEAEVEDLVAENNNLIIHNNPRNLGRSGCRNEGFDTFPADYYILNDADDVSLPDRVEKSLTFMKAHPRCGAMGGYVDYIDPEGNVFGKGTQMYCFTEEDARRYRESLEPVGLFCSSVCLRGDVINKQGLRFDTTLPASEDIELWNIILENGWDVLVQKEFLSQYRFHGDSICTSRFVYCKHHHMYVTDRLRRRRQNRTPISYDEFCKSQRARGLWQWLCFEYPIYAEYFYRTGGYHMVVHRYLKGALMLAASFIMEPRRVRRIIRQRLGKKV